MGLQGKVDKPKRKILAGACLLLSAKMHLDLRHGQAKELLEVNCNVNLFYEEMFLFY